MRLRIVPSRPRPRVMLNVVPEWASPLVLSLTCPAQRKNESRNAPRANRILVVLLQNGDTKRMNRHSVALCKWGTYDGENRIPPSGICQGAWTSRLSALADAGLGGTNLQSDCTSRKRLHKSPEALIAERTGHGRNPPAAWMREAIAKPLPSSRQLSHAKF